MTNQQAIKLINAELKKAGPKGVITKFWANIAEKGSRRRFINNFRLQIMTEKNTPQKALRYAMDSISNSFNWSRSLEGYLYWDDVSVKLKH